MCIYIYTWDNLNDKQMMFPQTCFFRWYWAKRHELSETVFFQFHGGCSHLAHSSPGFGHLVPPVRPRFVKSTSPVRALASWKPSPRKMNKLKRHNSAIKRRIKPHSFLECFHVVWSKPWRPVVPSGKRLHNYGKSPFSMGKSTINGNFQ